MSYIGGVDHPAPYEAYDLLGLSLAITSGVADPARARQALAAYPTWAAGSPVIWPQQPATAIYHNRAIWPFVSAYALRAARAVDDPARIEHVVPRGGGVPHVGLEHRIVLEPLQHDAVVRQHA